MKYFLYFYLLFILLVIGCVHAQTIPASEIRFKAQTTTPGPLPNAYRVIIKPDGSFTCIKPDGTSCFTVTASSVAWANITGIPTTFTPSAHTHSGGDINNGVVSSLYGGTGFTTTPQDNILVGAGTGGLGVGGGFNLTPLCNGVLSYDTTLHTFSCGVGGGGGASTSVANTWTATQTSNPSNVTPGVAWLFDIVPTYGGLPGNFDSHSLNMCGSAYNGTTTYHPCWRLYNNVSTNTGVSYAALGQRLQDANTWTDIFQFNDSHSFAILPAATDDSCNSGDYWIMPNSTSATWRKCSNGVISDIGSGGGGAFPAAGVTQQYYAFCNGVASPSTTISIAPFGTANTDSCTSVTSTNGLPIEFPGTIKTLRVQAFTGGINASTSGVVTLYKNGIATGIHCTLGTGTTCNDLTHTFTVNAGDTISVRVGTAAAETLASLRISFVDAGGGFGFNFRGAWAASTVYNPYDIVTYYDGTQTSTYEADHVFTSGTTFNAANWNIWASGQGAAGTLTGNNIWTGTNTFVAVNASSINTVVEADAQVGATIDAKLNACNTAVIALGGGVCDARGLPATGTIAAQVNDGNTAGVAVDMILPKIAAWAVTMTDGTSCGIKVFTAASLRSSGNVGGAPKMRITSNSAATSVDSLICTDGSQSGYSHIEGVSAENYPSGTAGTMANGAFHWRKLFDAAVLAHSRAINTNGIALLVDNVCCGATLLDDQAESANGAGGIPFKIGASVTTLNIIGGSLVHPGAGLNNEVIDDGATGTTGPVNHYGVYYEGNTNATETSPMIDVKNERGGANWYGSYVHPFTTGQTMYCWQIENVANMPVTIGAGNRCAGASNYNAVNDLFVGKTVVSNSAGAAGFVPDYVEDGVASGGASNYFHNGIISAGLTSSSANPATAGFIQSASVDQYCWRNNANSANICISKNTSDQLLYNGTAVVVNPMTAAGDVIAGGTAGAPTRLAQGANGTFLGVSGGTLGYYTPSGFGLLGGNNSWTGTNTFSGVLSASVINGVRAISQFAFSVFPVTPSSIAVGANTVTMPVGPIGVNGTDSSHYIEIAGTGTPEAALITGGTCTPFTLNCTLTFTAANTHAAGYSISSATAGCQEAYQDAASGSSLLVEPSMAHVFNATCNLTNTAKAITVKGDGVSSRISGDPGNAPLLSLNNGVTCTSPIRVTNLRVSNQHSTVTDTAEHAITVTSTCNFEIDNITYDAGKVGLFITSLGGGGQTQDGRLHDLDCWGPNFFGSLMDGCVWINGDNVSLPTVRMSLWNIWSHFLATTGHSGPPVDISCEDCIQSYGHHLYVYDDAGFTESGAGAFQIQANHDAAINDTWFSDVWAFKTGGANGIAFRMNANKTYHRVGIYNFHFDGYKQGLNLGQGYTADYQLDDVIAGPGELTNIDNSGAYGIIATGTGAAFRARLTIRGVKIRGTGAGTALIGIRCNLLNGLKLEYNDVQFVATHGFDFEGCSDGTLTGNISSNNSQTITTGNGFNFTANTSIGSSSWNINSNTASDTQAVHTQNYGFVNNSATDGPSCLGGSNVASNNVNDQFRDTPGKWIFGGNCSFGGTNSGAETMKVSTQKSGTSANTDANGTLTMAAGTATYTFTGTYTSHPNCSASDETAIAAVKVTYTAATSVTFTTAGATDVVDYTCAFRN